MENKEMLIAAIDVGSGMTKFVIGMVTGKGEETTIDVKEQLERPIPYGVDWKRSSDGTLSQNIQESGLKLFNEIQECIDKWKVATDNPTKYDVSVIAVGTEVFRKAKNGECFLKKVYTNIGLKIDVISQESEARIGFLTGKAALMTMDRDILRKQLDYDSSRDLVVYDSGGGSYQMSWINKSAELSRLPMNEVQLNTILKPNGLAPTLYDLLVLQEKPTTATPNPVSEETAFKLVDLLIDKYVDDEDIRQLVKIENPTFLSIGGINSHVRLAADILIRLQAESHSKASETESMLKSGTLSSPKFFSFTEESVRQALKRICDKKDEELERFAHYENAEPVTYMVPKLCILLAALRGYKLPCLHWVLSCGSCFGLMLNTIT